MTTELVTLAPVRASDAEREDAVARLHHALGEGRLDLAETEDRVTAAYAAQHRAELLPLLADLPHGSSLAGSGTPTWTALWSSVAWRARIAVLGSAAAATAPTLRQSRTVAVLVVLAVAWMVLWADVGAAVVG
jgi:hypothetical protein